MWRYVHAELRILMSLCTIYLCTQTLFITVTPSHHVKLIRSVCVSLSLFFLWDKFRLKDFDLAEICVALVDSDIFKLLRWTPIFFSIQLWVSNVRCSRERSARPCSLLFYLLLHRPKHKKSFIEWNSSVLCRFTFLASISCRYERDVSTSSYAQI